MLSIERKMAILDILRADKSASVSKLAQALYSSEATIRRDLDKLGQEGLIKRIFGGAVLLEGLSSEIPLYVRESEQQNQKNAIGMAAVEMVADGNTLIIDSSSTAYAMTKFISSKKNLNIITNGAKTAITLGEILHTNTYCTGGRLRENSLSYVGKTANSFIREHHADILFFSCRGVVLEDGLYEASVEEAELRQVMINCSDKRVLLCDNTKIGKYAFHRICELSDIDVIITNSPIEESASSYLEEQGIVVTVV